MPTRSRPCPAPGWWPSPTWPPGPPRPSPPPAAARPSPISTRCSPAADVDVVCVCVPSGLHAEIGIRAAKAGKHLVVEKPIDVTLAAADRLIEAARAAGVALTVISQHRFDPGLIELKRLLGDGALGRLVLGEASTKWYRTPGVLRQRRVARHLGDGRRIADEPGRPLRRPAPLVHGSGRPRSPRSAPRRRTRSRSRTPRWPSSGSARAPSARSCRARPPSPASRSGSRSPARKAP